MLYSMNVKVRIAPSPTGHLHIGTARTALFNWLFARHHGGQFIVRIEDTDVERSKKEFEHNIVSGLRWLGIDWDNTELIRQSERLPAYRARLEAMLASGTAAWRTYSEAEQLEMTQAGRAARDKVIVLVDGNDPEREIVFDDIIRGKVSVRCKHIGQIVLAKDLDTPLYNFAVVVDDIDMEITHVIRGEDHISNTPKQLLIYEALGTTTPHFAHLPLILGSDRSKMSKRDGATNMDDYQKDYLPDALVSFMGQLGYTYDQELLDKHEMAKQFDLSKVHSSGAVFDVRKLRWTNSQYIKRMTPDAFRARIGMPELSDAAVAIMTERLEELSDIEQFSYLWKRPDYEPEVLLWKEDTRQTAVRALQACLELAQNNELHLEQLDALTVQSFDAKKGSVYWPLRTSLSGLRNSAAPLDIASALGRDETIKRIEFAIAMLS